jgi:phage shock protein A
MDNRSIEQIAAAESPAYTAAAQRVSELERGRDRLCREIDELERESQTIAGNIAGGRFQVQGPSTRDVLEQQLADLGATLANMRVSLTETSRALETATVARDKILADFRASR